MEDADVFNLDTRQKLSTMTKFHLVTIFDIKDAIFSEFRLHKMIDFDFVDEADGQIEPWRMQSYGL